MIRNWVYYMRKGLEAMFPKTSSYDECTTDESCWCMEEVDENGSSTFPPIPKHFKKDKCLTPEQLEAIKREHNKIDNLTKSMERSDV